MGSHLHHLYDCDAAVHPARAVHRLHIREAQMRITGAARDDAVVEAIAEVMLQDLAKQPVLSERQVRRRLNAGLPGNRTFASMRTVASASDAIVATGRSSDAPGSFEFGVHRSILDLQRADDKQCHKPVTMMASTASALDRATGSKGQLAALPLFSDRKARKPQTKSVLDGKLAVWLQSDDAKDWRRDRLQLWAADDDAGE